MSNLTDIRKDSCIPKISRKIRTRLLEMQDIGYRDFHAKLVPTIEKSTVIGVRTPEVRKLAQEFAKEPDIQEFLEDLPHQYYDENTIHSFLIGLIKDYDTCLEEVERFLPYINNWATCDGLSPKVFAKHPEELIIAIKRWLKSEKPYIIRFGIEMLMKFYLDDNFQLEYPRWVAAIRSDEYYVKMMIAWYFATALAKQYDAILPFFEEKCMDDWTHNKAIQKARESYRVTSEQKEYLKTLKARSV